MLIAVLCWMAFFIALAAPPSIDAPTLRIEVGMHTAAIRSLAVSASGHHLVTASDDKTARVWDLTSGELLQVLRPPIGVGREGELHAVALAPDGATVAVAGWTTLAGQPDGIGIWLFSLANGRLVGRMGRLPSAVVSLDFSHDGTRLAAGLLGANGVRVFDLKSSSELPMLDGGAEASTFSVEFDELGRLLTASFDGRLRLYSGDLSLVEEVHTGQGRRPYSARFSPDGRRVAVGFFEEAQIELRSATDLRSAETLKGSRGSTGSLGIVAWSNDGQRVCAGGTARNDDGANVVRCWGDRIGAKNYVAGGNTVLAIEALPTGGLVISTHEPRWVVLNSKGDRQLDHDPPMLNFTNPGTHLYTSDSGDRVSFGTGQPDAPLLTFSVFRGQISAGRGSGLKGPIQILPTLKITGWNRDEAPALNGEILSGFSEFERARTLAIQPDGSRFAVGSDLKVHLYDSSGVALAHSELMPGTVWAVNWSGDRRFIIAAIGDGTIRWLHGDTLSQVLTLYIHPDRRWIVWSRSGYYHSSAGGAELAIWHSNRGSDREASATSLAYLRARFYRPDVVEAVIISMDESNAPNAPLCHLLPPSVEVEKNFEVIRHAGELKRLNLVVRRACTLAPTVEGLELRLNSREYVSLRREELLRMSATVLDDPLSLHVSIPLKGLPRSDANLTAFAYSDVASEPVHISVVWEGVKHTLLPRLFVLSVGVEDAYRDLRFPDNDADRFAQFWIQNATYSYAPNPSIRLLVNNEATSRAILEALEALKRDADRSTDVVLIFFAGHAQPHPEYAHYVFKAGGAQEGQFLDYVNGYDISRVLARIVGKVVLFLDTCAAGGVGAVARARGDSVDFANELHSIENGVIVLAGSSSEGRSLESTRWGGGVFTQGLLLGLQGAAASSNGLITLRSLETFVQEYVRQETQNSQLPRALWPPGEGSSSSFPIHKIPQS